MKRIEALIPHDAIQILEQSLSCLGVQGLTLTSVYQADATQLIQHVEVPLCKVDVLVTDAELSLVCQVFEDISGSRVPVQILVMDVETTLRIRTGESESAALH